MRDKSRNQKLNWDSWFEKLILKESLAKEIVQTIVKNFIK